jgi:RND family efflux transporter MFP subunit
MATLAALAASTGCSRAPEAAAARASEGSGAAQVASVTVVTPKREAVRKVTREPGQIEAFEATSLHAKVGGYVRSLAVDTGDTIRAGQVIAELDVPELQAEVEQKRALLEQAGAEREQADAAVAVAESAVTSAEAKVVQVQASIRRTQAEVARWQAEYNRTGQLVRESAVTASLLDETRSKLEAAQAAREETSALVRSAEAALAQAKAELAKSRSDVTAAAARVDVAKANLVAAEAMAGYAKIVAPFDGVITRRHVHTGHLPVPGGAGDPLFVAERTDRLRIVVGVPEVDAPFVQPGDRAEVRLQALEGRVVEGKVSRISWSLDRATRTLRAEIDLENPDGTLRPGLYAYVTIVAEEHPDALTLPAAAIIRDGSESSCMVVEGGKARQRGLRLGLSDGKVVEVTSGLEGGEAVVAANAGSLSDGQAVRVAEPATK